MRGSANANNGLEVKGSGSLLRGLAIGSFVYGVVLYGNNIRVEGCFLGTLDGERASANRNFGIVVFSASNVIGGSAAGQRNVISGNGYSGIDIEGAAAVGNQVLGNYIGLNWTGSKPMGNGGAGILLYGSTGARIGGRSPAERNCIGANQFSGIEMTAAASQNIVAGNFIGVDATGAVAIGNRGEGVFISSANQNRLGGTEPGEGNLISGNVLSGVNLKINSTLGGTTADIQILGNLIGTRADGLQAIPNLQAGILVYGVILRTVIGGAKLSERNVISGNRFNGIEIYGQATGTRILGNLIGLDLLASKALPNRGAGVLLTLASKAVIGGPVPEARNVISGNILSGIEITGDASDNSILGNWIGLDGTGTKPVPNQEAGILLSTASGNRIGGPAS